MQDADGLDLERAVRLFAAAMIGLAAHELNNRLAVMRETVGLMEDLARAGKSGVAGTERAHASLDDQVGRALNIVRAVSGLGSALGASDAAFDAGAALSDLVGLSERWARQRSLKLDFDTARELPRAAGDPALFLCLAHRLLEGCAGTTHPGGVIAVRVARDGDRVRASFRPQGVQLDGATMPGDRALDGELARRLGADLVFQEGGVATILLALPPMLRP